MLRENGAFCGVFKLILALVLLICCFFFFSFDLFVGFCVYNVFVLFLYALVFFFVLHFSLLLLFLLKCVLYRFTIFSLCVIIFVSYCWHWFLLCLPSQLSTATSYLVHITKHLWRILYIIRLCTLHVHKKYTLKCIRSKMHERKSYKKKKKKKQNKSNNTD